ncbi:MAG: CoA transferase [Rhodobiaceae bacterium]|nr:CoA transferase [Rhodobiaceae bacterium]
MTSSDQGAATPRGEEPISALDGIRVLDFTRHISGPCATQVLADFGADVIKVEGTPHGDGIRRTGTVFRGGESGLFLVANHGKRSVALDLRNPKVKAVLDRMVKESDVLIENFRPGVADALGLSYEYCRALNPRLIYVSISAFGQTGPLAKLPGTDPVVQAMSGIMSVTGEAGAGPVLVGVPIADYSAAMVGVQAVLMALVARSRTGRGQKVELSMLAALVHSWTTRLASYWDDGKNPTANGGAHSVVVPYQAYRTATGYAVAGVWGAGEAWHNFCRAIERTDLIDDPRFSDNPKRVKNVDQLNAILEPIFLSRTTEDWAKRFAREKALFGPVHKFSEVVNHPQTEKLNLFTEIEHPTLGAIPQLGPAFSLSETPGKIHRPPPLLGEHTRAVLLEMGWSEKEVAIFLSEGVAVEYPGETDVSKQVTSA